MAIEKKDLCWVYDYLYEEEPYTGEKYGDKIYEIINYLYDKLKTDEQLVKWLGCELNRREDLYDEFVVKIEDAWPTITSLEDENFAVYNAMTYDIMLYQTWTLNLMDYMIKEVRCKVRDDKKL